MSIPPHPPSSRYSHHSGWIIVPTLVVFPSTREADGLRFCQPDHFGVLHDKAVTARSGLAKLSVWLKPLRVLKRQLCGCPSTPCAVFFCLILGHSPGHWGWRIRVAGLRCPLSDVAWSDWASQGEWWEGTQREVGDNWCFSELVRSSYQVCKCQIY